MGTEANFTSSPLNPGHAQEWAELFAVITEADHGDDIMYADDFAEEFTNPVRDFARGSLAVYAGDLMVGFSVLQLSDSADPVHEMRQWGGVHPDYRGLGIGGRLLNWSEQAAMEVHEARFGGRPLALGCGCTASNVSACALFAAHGFPPARRFHQMTRDLSAGITASPVPEGVEIAGFSGERSADALAVRNDALRDHWATSDATAEIWAHEVGSQAFRPGFSFIAYLNGEPAGLVLADEYEAYNQAKGRRDLYIPMVGTGRAGRKRGIASALLTTVLTAAKADGFDTVTLDVDADSLTGAVRLYERLGFTVRRTKITHRKMLRE